MSDLHEPEAADAVALLRAYLAEDDQALDTMLQLVNPLRLLSVTIGVMLSVLAAAGVSESELDEQLAEWQQRRVLG